MVQQYCNPGWLLESDCYRGKRTTCVEIPKQQGSTFGNWQINQLPDRFEGRSEVLQYKI